jgi:hypothetical protein
MPGKRWEAWLLAGLVVFSGRSDARLDQPSTLVFPTFEHTWGIRKATSVHLFMFVGLRTRFDDPQGLAAVRLRSWDDPETEDDDDELVVYGVNSGQNNIIWNTSMTSVGVFGDDLLNAPGGIAADEDGHVWVADTGNHRLACLFNPGDQLVYQGTMGSPGTGPGQFRFPSDLAVDSQGRLYVTDTGNSRIQIFDADGRLLRIIEAGLQRPERIAVIDADEAWSYYGDTFLCVTDHDGRRLVKLSPDGELLKVADDQQTSWEKAYYGYPAIDYYGNIWVTDEANHCIHKFDRNLKYIVSFGREGDGDGEFRSPRGLAIWRRFGQVFVAEERGAQYYWIGVDLLDVGIDSDHSNSGFIIRFFLTERAYVTIEVRDEEDHLVGVLAANQQWSTGRHRVPWGGRRPGGGTLPAGWYTVRITAEATYSSYHYFQKTVSERIRL